MTNLAAAFRPFQHTRHVEAFVGIPHKYHAMLRQTRALEASLTSLSDLHLKSYITRIRRRLRDGHSTDQHLHRAFAAVCVVARRTVGLRPYNVQLIGGYELHQGSIAEMATGEGKTLVATLPAVLNGIAGRGVHIVTVNDYLAQRDAKTMQPIYDTLGMTVGTVINGMNDTDRRNAYACDVVYGTNKEFGFDYLRDQIKLYERDQPKPIDAMTLLDQRREDDPVQRELFFAIVDEADSILIDESRTPLVIAAPTGPSPIAWAYRLADELAQRMRPRHDFDLKVDRRLLDFTETGRKKLQKLLADGATPSAPAESWQNLVIQALRARWLFVPDQHYVIVDQDVVIVDEFTGRRMPGRSWNEGLHQAVQAKEKMPITAPSATLARTTYQHFFSLYKKLAGMTGTAYTERAELESVYETPVVRIPTHRPLARKAEPDRVYRTMREKWMAVAEEVLRVTGTGRPVLVGTHDIEESEGLSKVLDEWKIGHDVLNARPEHAKREAAIVAKAGQLGAVTISTNMAGRGTDIKLGAGVATLGGLHVIGTQRHESRRIDNQLIGRCGRQGDPGSCVFVLSLQDPLLRHMLDRRKIARLRRKQQLPFGKELTSPTLRGAFLLAQRKVEKMHYRMRQQLMEYEDWLNEVYYNMGSG